LVTNAGQARRLNIKLTLPVVGRLYIFRDWIIVVCSIVAARVLRGLTEFCIMTESNPAAGPVNPNNESFLPQSTVLIVDDNPQNVELLQAFLESLPVKLVTAADGVEALKMVAEHAPDLILLDIMMPRMSGFQVCRRIKNDPKTRDIQVLMVTALNELGDIEQATEAGTDDFVSKPVNKFELLTRVKSLLRVRHLKGELERALTYLNEIEQDEEAR
jgi:CheY-like chemotaxis protein